MPSPIAPELLLGLVTAAALWSAAQAQPAGSPDYQHCIASAGQRASALAKCEQAEYRRADKALNDAYNQLEDKISDAAKAPLVRAQRDWLGFRDSQCAYEAAAATADAPIVEARCMRRLSEQRAQELK